MDKECNLFISILKWYAGTNRVEVLLQIVRLEEMAMIQQICQMGHKPPVVESNAEETRGGNIRKEWKRIHETVGLNLLGFYVLYIWLYILILFCMLPALLDDLVDVKLKRSQ